MKKVPHNKITPPDREVFIQYYIEQNHSIEETAKFFHVCTYTIKQWIKLYDAHKSKEVTVQKRMQTNIERYGGPSPTSSKDIQTKIRQTCQRKYGYDHYMQNPAIQEKTRRTCVRKYGVPYVSQALQLKEKMVANQRKAVLVKYGVEFYSQSEDYKNRLPVLMKNMQESMQEKYGSNYYTSSDHYKSRLSEIQHNREQTNIAKYGAPNFSQTEEFRHKVGLKYYYQNEYFDSSWELALWIYARDHGENILRSPCSFEYQLNGKTHYYYPDFLYNGEIIEVKGDYFFNEDGTMYCPFNEDENQCFLAKQKCMKDNNVRVFAKKDIQFALDYIKQQYGTKFLKTCKH